MSVNDNTFLGLRDPQTGYEVHCAHEKCPHVKRCSHGCTDRTVKPDGKPKDQN